MNNDASGLPEMYTSPSKKPYLKDHTLNAGKVWDDSDSPILYIPITNNTGTSNLDFHGVPFDFKSKSYPDYTKKSKLINKQNTEFEKDIISLNCDYNLRDRSFIDTITRNDKERTRGKTPGSESPGDFLIQLSNLKLSTNIKDDYSNYTSPSRGDAGGKIISQDYTIMAYERDHSTKDSAKIPHQWVVESVDYLTAPLFTLSANLQEDKDMPPSISSSEGELNLLCRNSPVEVSIPVNIDNERDSSNIHTKGLNKRPMIGQSKDIVMGLARSIYVTHRKDLGSTDGEDSSNDSLKIDSKSQYQNKIQNLTEACSIGSQSENTDSTSTVLDMKGHPILECENKDSKISSALPPTYLSEPNFLVGGPMSPQTLVDNKDSLIDGGIIKTNERFRLNKDCIDDVYLKKKMSIEFFQDQQDSLPSVVSIESTHHPESSECITPPSIMSVSSFASSKKLEWDSGADVGYNRKAFEIKGSTCPPESLSTLERIAIGNYAAMLRMEPEGTTNIKCKAINSKARLKVHKSPNKSTNRPKLIYANSLMGNETYSKKCIQTFKSSSGAEILNNRHLGSSLKDDLTQTFLSDMSLDIVNNCSFVPNLLEKSQSISEMQSAKNDQYYNNEINSSCNRVKVQKHKDLPADDKFNSCSHFKNKSISSKSLPYYFISSDCQIPIYDHSKECSNSLQACPLKYNGIDLTENISYNKELSDDKTSLCSNAELTEPLNTSYIIHRSNMEEGLGCSFLKSNGTIDNYSSQSDANTTKESSVTSSIDKDLSSLSLSSINVVLSSFSNKLRGYVLNLRNHGSFSNLSDYDKLQDYIEFVGIPSNNDDQVKLKQSVADIIMRMFGDMNKTEVEKGNKDQELSIQSTSTDVSSHQQRFHSANLSIITDKNDKKSLIFEETQKSNIENKGNYKDGYKNDLDLCVPYRPSQASRTYFFIASDGERDSNVETKLLKNVIHAEKKEFSAVSNDNASSNKGVYQDRLGTLHIAHQPPGYDHDIDSHRSESTSENEMNKLSNTESTNLFKNSENLDTDGASHQRRNLPPTWTSTGSESAYETIRERHHNIGEELASSFEFYSTSPRDARALGYVSSDMEKPETSCTMERIICDESKPSEISLCPTKIPNVTGASRTSSKSSEIEFLSSSDSQPQQNCSRKSPKKCNRKSRYSRRPKAPSSIAESEGASSSASIVQVQRQRYVRRIRKYIHTLEKLERTLIPTSFDSLQSTKYPLERTANYVNKTTSGKTSDSSQSAGTSCMPGHTSDISSYKSSEGAVGDSLIVHQTFSAKTSPMIKHRSSNMQNKNLISSALLSKDSSPCHTSTLRKGREKTRRKKEKQSYFSEIRNCGEISDFRKLMASSSVPGEMRPYRYLLQTKEMENHEDIAIKLPSPLLESEKYSDSLIDLSTINLHDNGIDTSIKSQKNIDLSMKCLSPSSVAPNCFAKDILTETVSGQLSSNVSEPSPNDVEEELFKRANAIKVSDEIDGEIPAAKSFRPVPERFSHEKAKVTRDFCQMFPSTSTLNLNQENNEKVKTFQTDGTQTNLFIPLCNVADHSSVVHSNSNLNNVEKGSVSGSSKGSTACSSIVINLDQIETKIKYNATKINAALEAYNSQYGSPQKFYVPKDSSHVTLPQREFNQIKIPSQNGNAECIVEEKLDESPSISIPNINSTKFIIKIGPKAAASKDSLNRSLVEELIELNKESEIMTLQEALAIARPKYIKEAERRRIKICRKQTLRRELQEHNQSALALLPDNLKTPTILQKFLYKPDESPLFNYKTIREQNKRLYQRLPEAQRPGRLQKKASKSKSYRLMSAYYSQKLRGKVLKGRVSHAHRDVVTPIR